MSENKCRNCRHYERIQGQSTNICLNKALLVVAQKQHIRANPEYQRENSDRLRIDKLCQRRYWQPFSFWGKLKLWWLGINYEQEFPGEDEEENYEAGSWKEEFDDEIV